MRTELLSTIVLELETGKRPKGGATTESGGIPSIGGPPQRLTQESHF
jgi:hypothetical protein